jgi:hypothetical protein
MLSLLSEQVVGLVFLENLHVGMHMLDLCNLGIYTITLMVLLYHLFHQSLAHQSTEK